MHGRIPGPGDHRAGKSAVPEMGVQKRLTVYHCRVENTSLFFSETLEDLCDAIDEYLLFVRFDNPGHHTVLLAFCFHFGGGLGG